MKPKQRFENPLCEYAGYSYWYMVSRFNQLAFQYNLLLNENIALKNEILQLHLWTFKTPIFTE